MGDAPRWEAAGSFNSAMHNLATATVWTNNDHAKGLLDGARQAAVIAHPVVIPRSQVVALPRPETRDLIAAEFSGMRAPFEVTYVCLDGAAAPNWTDPDQTWIAGALVLADDEALLRSMLVFLGGRTLPTALPIGFAAVVAEQLILMPLANVDDGDAQLIGDAAERVLAALALMTCSNVEVGEVEVSRQVRRAAERRKARIAHTVKVQRSGRRHKAHGGVRNYSHRFERAGAWHKVTRGATFDAAPDKRVWREDVGWCRLRWCPPTVVGPDDKPFIPKTRILEAV